MRVRCRQPGEWWYDEATQELFLWPNSTAPDGLAAPPLEELVVPVLQTLIRFKGTVSHRHCWHLGCILPRVPATIVRTGQGAGGRRDDLGREL